MGMNALAVVVQRPQQIVLSRLELIEPQACDVVVEVDFSGISTGTEKLLWNGRMPSFPGMGYPLVPGYEAVGRVVEAGPTSGRRVGERVFVPGARCFGEVRGLFGASASRLVVAGERAGPLFDQIGEEAILLALAATAYHAVAGGGRRREVHPPELIVGHGVLGRLLARMTVAGGYPAPTVWETDPVRSSGACGYEVIRPEDDKRRDYRAIYDVSGDALIIDRLVARLAPGGEIVLAGFYEAPLSFVFPPAFMREARLRIAAEFLPADLAAVMDLITAGKLSLSGLISHRAPVAEAAKAYETAFADPACVKMILDWRTCP